MVRVGIHPRNRLCCFEHMLAYIELILLDTQNADTMTII